MARKFTKFEIVGDEDEIRRILKLHYGDGHRIRFHYTRDDRLIDLDNKQVYIYGEEPSPDPYIFSFDSSGRLIGDSLCNARYDEETYTLYFQSVFAHSDEKQDKNGVLYLTLKEVPVFDFSSGRVLWHETLLRDRRLSELLLEVKGTEFFAKDIAKVEEVYSTDLPLATIFKIWFFVQRFNLYDYLCGFSRVISLGSDGQYNLPEEYDNFFEAINVAPEFIFALSDIYLKTETSRYSTSWYYNAPWEKINKESGIYRIYEGIEDEDCRKALLNGAELKYYNLGDIAYGWAEATMNDLLEDINTNASFFLDYISSPALINRNDVLCHFSHLCDNCREANLTPSRESLGHIDLAKKAKKLELSIDEYVSTLNSFNTKEGLIAFYRSIGN